MKPKRPYGDNSLWTVLIPGPEIDAADAQAIAQEPLPESVFTQDQFDLCFVEVSDEGEFEKESQLDGILDRIQEVRRKSHNGAVVVLFIHGWHNNAKWDNKNLESFRRLLQSLMLREMERHGRRVIGIYLGWNGDPSGKVSKWLSRIPVVTHTSFHNRYGVAGTIGQGDALTKCVRKITHATKESLDSVSSVSPLVFTGHSMGAFILQSSVLALIENGDLEIQSTGSMETAQVRKNGIPIHMPDLILSLNSAAESAVAQEIILLFEGQDWSKTVSSGSVQYDPPMLISVTSKADTDTSWKWEFMKRGKTDGHNPALASHSFKKHDDQSGRCDPLPGVPNFGQPWHCIEGPHAPFGPSPSFVFKLPTMWPKDGEYKHRAYELKAKDASKSHPFWIFQVPKGVIKDHGDIFNYQAASLTLALIQISGALASVAQDWEDSFG